MIEAKLINDTDILVTFDFNWEIVNDIKKIDRNYRKFDKALGAWILTVDRNSLRDILLFFHEYNIDISSEIESIIEKQKKKALKVNEQYEINKQLSKSLESNFEVNGLRSGIKPYSFQNVAVEYVTKNKNVLIGDAMGLGKTIEAIASITHNDAFPCLVICPASLKGNWRNEWNKFTRYKPEVIESKTTPTLKNKVSIINYDIVDKYYDKLSKVGFKSIIVDESHMVKNPKSKRTKAVKKLAKKVEYRILLSGTSVVNKPVELIPQLEILGVFKKEFGDFFQFTKRYCGAYKGRFGYVTDGATNILELHDKLASTCYVRRNKKDVLTQLPDKQRQVIDVDITNRKEYDKAERDLIKYLKQKAVKSSEFKQTLKSLSPQERKLRIKEEKQKVASKAMAAEHLVRINELKQITSRGKLDSTIEFINTFIESDEKVLVFVNYTDTAKKLVEKFNCLYITGETPINKRQEIVDTFQANENEKVIVLNLKAAGVGLTLTSASNVVFAELGWTWAEHEQAEDRSHRIGQKNSVNVYYLLGENTIDLQIYDLIQKKRVITDGINAGEFPEFADQDSVMKELINRLTMNNG